MEKIAFNYKKQLFGEIDLMFGYDSFKSSPMNCWIAETRSIIFPMLFIQSL